jgi:hypothetical protein
MRFVILPVTKAGFFDRLRKGSGHAAKNLRKKLPESLRERVGREVRETNNVQY